MKQIKILILIAVLFLVGCSTVKQAPQIDVKSLFEKTNFIDVAKQLPVNPNQIQCVDTLGSPLYPKELRSIPNHMSIGIFDEAFGGDALKTVEDELKEGRRHVRVNLLWSDTHSFSEKSLGRIENRSREYNKLCLKYPASTLQIAPLTEHNVKNPDVFLTAVKANAPNCGKPVNSVFQGSFTRNPAFENEVHGNKADPKIPGVALSYSYDGTNSVDSDITKKLSQFSNAVRFCVWHPRLNLRYRMGDPTPRAQRIKEASKRKPSKDLILSLVYLFSGRGQVSLPAKWLLKSHADNHGPNAQGVSDAKGDKLLIISPVKKLNKKGKVKPIVLKRDGKKVCSLNYYDKFDGGGWRYYAQIMGYLCGAALDVFIGSQKHGVVNGGFRLGEYREK